MSEDMDVTRRVREHSGREIWNPHVIQDAPPPGEAVPPPIPMATFPPSRGKSHRDDDDFDGPTSEVVDPREFSSPTRPIALASEPVPQADLVIVDNVATYKGIGVTLDDRDLKIIQGIITQCAYREQMAKIKQLKLKLKDLKSPVPRKRRVKKAKTA